MDAPHENEVVVERHYLQCMAQATYVVRHAGVAFLVDPRRDATPILTALQAKGIKLKGVLLTHSHADFVAGHMELHRSTGVTIFISDKANVDFPHYPCADGEQLVLSSRYALQAIQTPGHTLTCTTWLLLDKLAEGGHKPIKAFTGDTLFVGSCGRPDLVSGGPQGIGAHEMASIMFDTLRNKIMNLPPKTQIYPAHGAGSPCGANLSDKETSTIEEEIATNPALLLASCDSESARAAFVDFLVSEQPNAPQYFSSVVNMNNSGAGRDVSELVNVPRLAPSAFAAQVAATQGAVILDTRSIGNHVAGHVPGSLNFPVGTTGGVTIPPGSEEGTFAIYVGSVIAPGSALFIVADEDREEETIVRLARVGYENCQGVLLGGFQAWSKSGQTVACATARVDPSEMELLLSQQAPAVSRATDNSKEVKKNAAAVHVLDVRTPKEYSCVKNGRVHGAINIPLQDLSAVAPKLNKDVRYVAYCRGGFRSGIAASILRAHGLDATDVVGGYTNIRKVMPALTTVHDEKS